MPSLNLGPDDLDYWLNLVNQKIAWGAVQNLTDAQRLQAQNNVGTGTQLRLLADLKRYTAGLISPIYVTGRTSASDGYEGLFTWRGGDQSAMVTADPYNGICVAPNSAPSGGNGAWFRDFTGAADGAWWGMVGDSNGSGAGTDNTALLQHAMDALSALGGGPLNVYARMNAATYLISAQVLLRANVQVNAIGAVRWDTTPIVTGINIFYGAGSYGTPVNLGVDINIPNANFAVVGSIALTTLTVTSVTSGTVRIGSIINGTGITPGPTTSDSTYIQRQISGTTGGIGTYQVSISRNVASTAITGTYNNVIVTATPHGLAVGDWLQITSNLNSLGDYAPDGWRLGIGTGSSKYSYYAEPLEVRYVFDAYTVGTSSSPEFPVYATTPEPGAEGFVSTVKKINWLNGVEFNGGTIIFNKATARVVAPVGLRFDLCYKPKSFGLSTDMGPQPSIGIISDHSYAHDIRDPFSYRPAGWFHGAVDHSLFNSWKDVSWFGQWTRQIDFQGSQGLDCTYGGSTFSPRTPPMHTRIVDPVALYSNETGTTFHPGCYCAVVTGARFIGCADTAFFCRSRGVTFTNFDIANAGAALGTASAIVYEGYAVNGLISDGLVDGYLHAVRHSIITVGGEGPPTFNLTISNVTCTHCDSNPIIMVKGTIPNAVPSGLVIDNVTIDNCYDDGIYIQNYCNYPTITNTIINNLFDNKTTGLSSSGIVLDPNVVGAYISSITANNVGAPSYVVKCSSAITDTATFPAATYPTQRHVIDWPSITLTGTGKLSAMNATYFNTPTGDYTLAAFDSAGVPILPNASSSAVMYVPDNATVQFPPNCTITFCPKGGPVAIAPLNGSVQITSVQQKRILAPGGTGILRHTSITDSWNLTGDLLGGTAGESIYATIYFASWPTPPSSALRAILNTFINGWIGAGLMPLSPALYLHSLDDASASLINVFKPSKVAVPTSGITWVARRGFTGTGLSTDYIDFGEHYDAAGNGIFVDVPNQLASATLACWVGADNGGPTGLVTEMGSVSGSAVATVRSSTTGNENYTIGDATLQTSRPANGSRVGFRGSVRSDFHNKKSYFNGGATGAFATDATTINTGNACILKSSTSTMIASMYGPAWSAQNFLDAYNLLTALFVSLGTPH